MPQGSNRKYLEIMWCSRWLPFVFAMFDRNTVLIDKFWFYVFLWIQQTWAHSLAWRECNKLCRGVSEWAEWRPGILLPGLSLTLRQDMNLLGTTLVKTGLVWPKCFWCGFLLSAQWKIKACQMPSVVLKTSVCAFGIACAHLLCKPLTAPHQQPSIAPSWIQLMERLFSCSACWVQVLSRVISKFVSYGPLCCFG